MPVSCGEVWLSADVESQKLSTSNRNFLHSRLKTARKRRPYDAFDTSQNLFLSAFVPFLPLLSRVNRRDTDLKAFVTLEMMTDKWLGA